MDPYQDNQDNTAAGGSRQALFTPEPTVQPEVPIVDAPTQPLHPYLSNHPTQTFNTEAGDIILNTDAPKPKLNIRPFIIGGAILVGVVAVIVVVMMIASNSDRKQPATTIDIEAEFNQYTSHLLYGNSESNLPETYNPYLSYELDNRLSASYDEAYWDKAADLLNTAIDAYAEKFGENDTLAFLRFHQQNLQFLRSYNSKGDLSEELVIAKYLSEGLNNTKSYVQDFYSELDTTSSQASEFTDKRILQYQTLADVLEHYKQLGCLLNGKFDNVCISNIALDDLLLGQWGTIHSQERTASSLLQETIRNFENNCWVLKSQLNNSEQANGN